jgi:hypothetical protein
VTDLGPKRTWFKLVGAIEKPVPPCWETERPDLFTEIYFPRKKPPTDVANGERIILYAVGDRVLIATQTVVSALPKRRGKRGSDEFRWPWGLRVETHFFCSPLKSAPGLHEIAPEFDDRYAKRFRRASHWEIDEPEYDQLASAIEASGRRYSPA